MTVSSPTFATKTVTFTVGTPAANALLMQPRTYNGRTLTSIKRGTTTLTTTTQVVNGVSYAFFNAGTAGTYTATYA